MSIRAVGSNNETADNFVGVLFPHDAEGLKGAYQQICKDLQPIQSGYVTRLVMAFGATMGYVFPSNEEKYKLATSEWVRALKPYPAWAIDDALTWIRDNHAGSPEDYKKYGKITPALAVKRCKIEINRLRLAKQNMEALWDKSLHFTTDAQYQEYKDYSKAKKLFDHKKKQALSEVLGLFRGDLKADCPDILHNVEGYIARVKESFDPLEPEDLKTKLLPSVNIDETLKLEQS